MHVPSIRSVPPIHGVRKLSQHHSQLDHSFQSAMIRVKSHTGIQLVWALLFVVCALKSRRILQGLEMSTGNSEQVSLSCVGSKVMYGSPAVGLVGYALQLRFDPEVDIAL
jgi:hypothetical protein